MPFVPLFIDEHGQVPPLYPRRGWLATDHRPTPLGLPPGVVVRACATQL
jgi:hypothetical protein